MTLKQVEETGEQRAPRRLWRTMLLFLPALVVVAYVLLLLFYGIDYIIRERTGQ
ncbi:MAG: hypothetical protein QGG73_07180 [Candidatus Hydrogenedentes bacterium]|nr:hypothetical protein [Candidatus Hydrogenedentota bacterium]